MLMMLQHTHTHTQGQQLLRLHGLQPALQMLRRDAGAEVVPALQR